MPRKRPDVILSVEEIRELAAKEIPYVVGDGTKCIQRRERRIKELMRLHGHKIYDSKQHANPQFGANHQQEIDWRDLY